MRDVGKPIGFFYMYLTKKANLPSSRNPRCNEEYTLHNKLRNKLPTAEKHL